jgi:hypothetical protein
VAFAGYGVPLQVRLTDLLLLKVWLAAAAANVNPYWLCSSLLSRSQLHHGQLPAPSLRYELSAEASCLAEPPRQRSKGASA